MLDRRYSHRSIDPFRSYSVALRFKSRRQLSKGKKLTKMEVAWSRGSSVSVVSDYGLDDRAVGVRSQTGAKDFSSSLCVQTGPEAHPASCTMDTGGPFPGAKRGQGVTLTTQPHPVSRSRMSRSYTSSPSKHHIFALLLEVGWSLIL
jgi:hypothetical protein